MSHRPRGGCPVCGEGTRARWDGDALVLGRHAALGALRLVGSTRPCRGTGLRVEPGAVLSARRPISAEETQRVIDSLFTNGPKDAA
jgi:hypothetical protein